jgi:membrane-bound ClpP family serine protease
MQNKIDIKLIFRTIADSGKILLLLLDEALVIAAVLLVLHFRGIHIGLPIMITGGIIIGIFVLIIHIAVIPSFHIKQVTGKEAMIGERGKVVEPLTPGGTVVFEGEYWRAESVEGNIGVEELVEIVEVEGLTLKVRRTHT